MRPLPVPALPVPSPAAGARTGAVSAPRDAARHRPARRDELPPLQRHGLSAAVLLLHLGVAWGVLHMRSEAVAEAPPPAPLMVQWIAPPAPTPPAPPPPPRTPQPKAPTPPKPVVVAEPVQPTPAPAFTAPPAPPEPAPPAPVAAAPSPAPAPVAPPAAPAGPKLLPSSAVQYLSPPDIVYPAASKRLGETGTVVLKVVVTAQGAPREVSVHKSSGYARLDEAAVRAMRGARFKPYMDQGQPVEWMAYAPIDFALD